jgi:hypothetical protein
MRPPLRMDRGTLFALMIPALVPSVPMRNLEHPPGPLRSAPTWASDEVAFGVRRHRASSAFRFLIEANANKLDGRGCSRQGPPM